MSVKINKEDKKQIVLLFLKLEVAFLILSTMLGGAAYYAYDIATGLKLFLFCFIFIQPFILYPYKDFLLLLIKGKK